MSETYNVRGKAPSPSPSPSPSPAFMEEEPTAPESGRTGPMFTLGIPSAGYDGLRTVVSCLTSSSWSSAESGRGFLSTCDLCTKQLPKDKDTHMYHDWSFCGKECILKRHAMEVKAHREMGMITSNHHRRHHHHQPKPKPKPKPKEKRKQMTRSSST